MKLYFLRHAHAEPGEEDATRRLSAKGRVQCHVLGQYFRAQGVAFDAVFTSPLCRARETAAQVAAVCHPEAPPPVREADALLNEATQEAFDAWLDGLPPANRILLVGHAPSLPAHARRMLGMPHADALDLPKAGVVCIQTMDRRQGRLKLFLCAKHLSEPMTG